MGGVIRVGGVMRVSGRSHKGTYKGRRSHESEWVEKMYMYIFSLIYGSHQLYENH